MILSFSDPRFEARIKAGIKIHTIREDKHSRWKHGMKIHFWMHNPRNVKKNPYTFGEGEVSLVSAIEMTESLIIINFHPGGEMTPIHLSWGDDGGKIISTNDGFDSAEEMKAWFKPPFKGRLIYWTNCKWY